MNSELKYDCSKSLYKWKRQSTKLNSKIKESDNIQDIHKWLRKVENASEDALNEGAMNALNLNSKATNKVLDKNHSFFTKFPKTNEKFSHNVNYNDDNPFSEAHDLINQWVADKIRLDLDEDIYNYVNIDEMNSFSNNQKVLDEFRAEIIKDDVENMLEINSLDYDKYDEDYIAKDILNKMMKKNLIQANSKKLLLDEPKFKPIDYQIKIEMRHQAVKENREKHQKELEKKRKDKLEKHEIEIKAKQIVQKEEQDKIARIKIEEQLIEQEVQRLRIQMAKERQKENELLKKTKEMEMIRLESERQEMANLRKKFDISNIENELEAKRYLIAEKRVEDLVNTYLRIKNMKKIQNIFSSWYGLVLDNRLKVAKANALADWKISFKVFNGWKKIVIIEKLKKNQEIQQNIIKVENIKNAKASNHYSFYILKKYFEYWKKNSRYNLLVKETENERKKTRERISKFLEAAVVNDNIQSEEENIQTKLGSNRVIPARNIFGRSKSFDEKKNCIKVNEIDDQNIRLNLSSEKNIKEKKVKEMLWPWVKMPFSTNNFDNRFKTQEKLLHEQHKMIKEQQKLIEDMKFQQAQVAFKEQIALLEQIKAKQLELEKMQKLQYKQEKKLISEKVSIKNVNKKIQNEEAKTTESRDEIESGSEQIFQKNMLPSTNLSIRTSPRTITTSRKQDFFSKNMEERAKQRDQMRKDREEKRKKSEQEKIELFKTQQEENLRIVEEERKKKLEEIREKKKIQKELEDKRNIEKFKEQASQLKADSFYKMHLLRYYCMNGLKKLMELRKSQIRKAITHYNKKRILFIIFQWKTTINNDLNRKKALADTFNQKRIYNYYFKNGFKKLKQSIQIDNAKAGRYFKYKIKSKYLQAWKKFKDIEKEKEKDYEILLVDYNINRIKIKYFKIWKMYPAEQKQIKQKKKRMDELRNKVREILPDFNAQDLN